MPFIRSDPTGNATAGLLVEEQVTLVEDSRVRLGVIIFLFFIIVGLECLSGNKAAAAGLRTVGICVRGKETERLLLRAHQLSRLASEPPLVLHSVVARLQP